jgi:hypothetical protein
MVSNPFDGTVKVSKTAHNRGRAAKPDPVFELANVVISLVFRMHCRNTTLSYRFVQFYETSDEVLDNMRTLVTQR